MLALRIREPAVLTRIQVHETLDLTRTRMVMELRLEGRTVGGSDSQTV
jgi:hypothetical protein